MTLNDFHQMLMNAVPAEATIPNPGGGMTTVVSTQNGRVRYRRGRSVMNLKIDDMHAAYTTFNGRLMSSKDLKATWPATYDSAARPAGHSCNVTMLFCALKAMGLVQSIQGKGVAGNPFFVDLSTSTA